MRNFQSVSPNFISSFCTFPEVASEKKNSFVHTSTLCLNHPTSFMCKMNLPGMQVTRRRYCKPEALFRTVLYLCCRSLSKSPSAPRWFCFLACKQWGLHLCLVCRFRWHCLGANHTDQQNNVALHDLLHGFLYLTSLLQGMVLK